MSEPETIIVADPGAKGSARFGRYSVIRQDDMMSLVAIATSPDGEEWSEVTVGLVPTREIFASAARWKAPGSGDQA